MESVKLDQLYGIIKDLKDISLLIDHDTTILDINPVACRKLSVEREKVIGKGFREMFCTSANCQSCNLVESTGFICHFGKNNQPFQVQTIKLNYKELGSIVLLTMIGKEKSIDNKFRVGETINELITGLLISENDGKIIYCDNQFTQLSCLKQEQVIGRNIVEVFPNNSYFLYNYLKGGKHQLEYEIIRIDCNGNSEKYLRVDIMMLPNETEHRYWLFREAEDYSKITNELLQKDHYLSSIFRVAPVGIGVLVNKNLYYINHRITAITGYSAAELLGHSIEMLFAEKAEFEKHFKKAEKEISRNGIYNFETLWLSKENDLKYIQFSITAIDTKDIIKGLTFTVLDITEKKHNQNQLEISEKRYRKLIDEAADAIFIVQAYKGIIIKVNQKACKLTLYTQDEILGRHISTLFPNEISPEYMDQFISESWTREHAIARADICSKDGKLIPVEINNTIVEDISGPLIIGFYRDLSDRINWKQKLEDSELRYRSLFNSVQEGIVIAELGSKSIQLVNQFMCKLFGYTDEEFSQMKISDILPDDQFITQHTSNNVIGLIKTENVLCRRKNGGKLYVDLRTSTVQMDSRNLVAIYVSDVTNRYEQQLHLETINNQLNEQQMKYSTLNDKLQESYENIHEINKQLENTSRDFNKLFNEMVSGFAVHEMIYDKNGNPYDYRYISANPAFGRLTGLDPVNIIGKTIREITPEIEEYWIEKFGNVAKTGKPISYQNFAKDLDRYYETVVYSPEKDKFAVVFNDVTQREKSSSELNKLFNLSIDLICITDFDGLFIKTNPAFFSTLGYIEEEIKMRKLYEFVHEDDRFRTSQLFKEELANGESVINFQTRYYAKDGRLLWLSWTAQPLTKEKMIFAIGRDITIQKKAEQELIEAKEKAIESDKLKSAFLANMSHEVRTPMNAIVGFSSLLDNEEIDLEKRKKYTHVIRSRCDDLLRIIDDILDISRIESGQVEISPTEFSIDDFLSEVHELHLQKLKMVEKSHLFLNKEQVHQPLTVFNDYQRLLQVFNNLLDNSIKFTLKGGITFGCRDNGDQVLFFVSDTGVGITRDKFQVIFERFRQAEDSLNRKFGGNGLGLAISRPLINLMGGDIWLESEMNTGTTFYFTIDKYFRNFNANGNQRLRNRKILIVEDDRPSVDYMRILLEQSEIRITHARTGNEAVELIKHGHKFDLILMDIQLSDISGIDVTRQIRKMDLEVPIIAQTAYVRTEDRNICFEAGCNDYLTKPVDDEDLMKALNKHIR